MGMLFGGGSGAQQYTGASSYPQYQQRFIPPPAQPTPTQPTQIQPQPSATNPAVVPTSSVAQPNRVADVAGGGGIDPTKRAGGMGIGV
jgi:hypothetical protein